MNPGFRPRTTRLTATQVTGLLFIFVMIRLMTFRRSQCGPGPYP